VGVPDGGRAAAYRRSFDVAVGLMRLAMAANTGANLKGLRDRALLLIGFAGALRRSELVALNIEDIEEAPGRNENHNPSQQDGPRRRGPNHRHSVR
jgi:integrase